MEVRNYQTTDTENWDEMIAAADEIKASVSVSPRASKDFDRAKNLPQAKRGFTQIIDRYYKALASRYLDDNELPERFDDWMPVQAAEGIVREMAGQSVTWYNGWFEGEA